MSTFFPDGSLSNQVDRVGVPAGSISTNAPTVSMEITTDRKRGRLSPLSQAQQNAVRARFPQLEEQLLKYKLHLGKPGASGSRARDPERLVAWINNTVKEIKATPAFVNVDDTSRHIDTMIKEMFKNYRNNTFIKRNKAAMVQEVIANKTETPTASAMEASKAAEALVTFKTPAAAKDIFREKHLEEIRQESTRLRAEAAQEREALGVAAENPRRNDNGGAYFQKALSNLWQKADQEHYQKMVNNDRFANQGKFNAAMKTALTTICQSGALGPTEMVLLSGFRNKENEVQLSILNAHHIDPADGIPPPAFLQVDEQKGNLETLVTWWREYCKLHIPRNIIEAERPSIPDNPYIMYNHGIPVLAKFELATFSPLDLAKLMKEFLSKLWEFTWPKDQVRPSIPLLEIQAHPDDFYDTGKYTFPVPLGVIESTEVTDIWALATYLLQICACSCSAPFTFRSKEDIERRTASRSREEELTQYTGQEIVTTDIEVLSAGANPPSNPDTWELRSDLASFITSADNSNVNVLQNGLNPKSPSNPMSWGVSCDLPPPLPDANVSSERLPSSWEAHSDFSSIIPDANTPSDPNAWDTHFDIHSLASKANPSSNHLSMVWDNQSHFPAAARQQPGKAISSFLSLCGLHSLSSPPSPCRVGRFRSL
ncbi:hypothetical protein F5880DRAFT_1616379 [Lentinula raphanica]|nr:hypothetical protein F5880DRAFT_1616379 [Lentinula raphanica]